MKTVWIFVAVALFISGPWMIGQFTNDAKSEIRIRENVLAPDARVAERLNSDRGVELKPRNAEDILRAYGSMNDRMQGFAIHYVEETYYENKSDFLPTRSGGGSFFTEGWFYQDFVRQRALFKHKKWGQLVTGQPPLAEDDGSIMQYRWEDGVMYSYLSGRDAHGISRSFEHTQRYMADPLTLMTSYFPGTEAIGYFSSDQRRLDQKLAGANLSMREGMQAVGNSMCYVIEGQTRFGWIAAWFDPEKDFAVVKYTVEAASNDISRDNLTVGRAYKVYPVTVNLSVTMEAFSEVNGVWLPAKVVFDRFTSLPQGNFRKTRRTITLDSWSVNPDFDALHAFELTDIPDDSIWEYRDDPGVHYRWNGGNLTPVSSAAYR